MAAAAKNLLMAVNPLAAAYGVIKGQHPIQKALSPKQPKLPPLPAYDDQADEDREAAERRRKLLEQRARSGSGRSGRQGTLLTGPWGVTTQAPTYRKTLLGQ